MNRKISYILYRIIHILNFFYKILTKREFLIWFKDFIEKDSYTSLNVLDKKILFFTPINDSKWRIDSFFSKEPETLEWIDNFNKNKKITF